LAQPKEALLGLFIAFIGNEINSNDCEKTKAVSQSLSFHQGSVLLSDLLCAVYTIFRQKYRTPIVFIHTITRWGPNKNSIWDIQ